MVLLWHWKQMRFNKIGRFLLAGVFAILGVFAFGITFFPSTTLAIVGSLGLAKMFGGTTVMAIVAGGRFQETPCSVVIGNNYDTHGTITRASVAQLTPSQLEALFKPSGLFADMDQWLRTQFEMKACGTKVNGMYEWLMSSQRNMGSLLSTEKVDRGPGLLRPFVLGRQDSVVNSEYWVVVGGAANSGYTGNDGSSPVGTATTGPLTTADKAEGAASDRVVRIVTRYGFDLDPKFFAPRDRIHLFNLSNGQTAHGQWKVLASAVSDDLSYIDVLVTSENAGSTTPYDSTPTTGIVMPGTNNVNDFESFCQNRPTLDPRKRVPFWYKTDRWGRRVDSEYKAVFARLMESNEFFRQFGDLPLAERNRQDEELRQRRWINDFFWSKKISANQTMANWQSLEQITTVTGSTVDPGLGGKLVAFRANPVGVMEQLRACGRVKDLQNNPLNFDEFLDENYRIMRSRKSQGRMVDTLDWFTDSVYAAQMETAFINYLKREYGDIVRIQIDEGSNELGFSWRIFKPKYPVGLKIAIVTHEYFDDMVNAFGDESLPTVGRVLWCLDIGKPGAKGGTIYPGTIATNRKNRTLGELEQLARIDPTFACTMEHITEEISLISETWTAVCECPSNSCSVIGIAPAVPTTTGRSLAGGNSYLDLY
jgi:hypothetical protein